MAKKTLKRLFFSSRRESDLSCHREKLISSLGAGFSICCILLSTSIILDSQSTTMIVASMGASAVLLFSIPQGPLSKPWSVFGGHIISALIGVGCYKYIPLSILAASVAVGLSVATMIYMKCLHPPGGATALMAVTGGDTIQQLGFSFVLIPIMSNVLFLLAFAFIFNNNELWQLGIGKNKRSQH